MIPNPQETDDEGNARTFSLAASPNHKETIMFATRMRSSAFKNNLKNMPLGTILDITAAQGSFTLGKTPSKPVVFLAGGIGITPFRSMVEWAVEQKNHVPVSLFYSNRNLASSAFFDDFKGWSASDSQFRFFPTMTDEVSTDAYANGPITADMLKADISELDTSIFYIAGPAAMVSAMIELLNDIGVEDERIRTELFVRY
jgi:ferredoxin-NADP reductase